MRGAVRRQRPAVTRIGPLRKEYVEQQEEGLYGAVKYVRGAIARTSAAVRRLNRSVRRMSGKSEAVL
jgi:hypothetical protein